MVYYGGTYNFVDLFQRLDYWGLTDALLPFLFVFAIVFAIMQKTEILGPSGPNKPGRKFNAVIAFVVGMFVVVPHIMGTYPPGYDVVEIMKAFLPGVSAVLIAAIMMLILIGLFGGSPSLTGKVGGWVSIISFIIIVYIFGASAQWWGGWYWLTSFFGEDAIALIIMLLVFGLIVAYILSGERTQGTTQRVGFVDELGNSFFARREGGAGRGADQNPPRTTG